jgi:hypothetical protein
MRLKNHERLLTVHTINDLNLRRRWGKADPKTKSPYWAWVGPIGFFPRLEAVTALFHSLFASSRAVTPQT